MDIFEVKPVEILRKRPKVDGYDNRVITGHRLLLLNMPVGDPMYPFFVLNSQLVMIEFTCSAEDHVYDYVIQNTKWNCGLEFANLMKLHILLGSSILDQTQKVPSKGSKAQKSSIKET